MRKWFLLLLLAMILMLSSAVVPIPFNQAAAAESSGDFREDESFSDYPEQAEALPDYSDPSSWLRIPEITKEIDTIYIYPMTYNDTLPGASEICSADDDIMCMIAGQLYEEQATAYENSTNVFAPYYRQINMTVNFTESPDRYNELLQSISKEDIFAALDYYFENMNRGRPFVLAGYFQGAQMLSFVLSEYMTEHEEYYDRMVASYLYGYTVTDQFLQENPHLKIAESAFDSGVIISWNMEWTGMMMPFNPMVMNGAFSFNPMYQEQTDNRRNDPSPPAFNIPDRNPNRFRRSGFVGADFKLWYRSIQENVDRRAAYYLADLHERIVDYSDPANWYQIPEITKEVDTFFIYPTLFMDTEKNTPDYAAIGDPVIEAEVDVVYEQQASVFEESTNLFIPYYQQANLKIEALKYKQEGDVTESLTGEYPQQDIWAALDYYFEHYNEGRPFIIAGHSQGSALVRLALKEYFAVHPEYYERMVAAYVLGYSITEDDLEQYPHLHFAQGEDDTGVIVSWNTEGPGNKNAANLVVLEGAISINPLNWKLDDTYAPAEENLGSLVQDEKTKQYVIDDIGADAQIDPERGVVVCTTTAIPFFDVNDVKGVPDDLFGPESFHNGDYQLWYKNIQENVKTRIEAYQKSHDSR